MTKMNWDRVHIENHIYRESRGSHVRSAGGSSGRTGNFGWRHKEWAIRHGWLKPKPPRKPRKGARECPECSKAVIGMEQHRRDKHGVGA